MTLFFGLGWCGRFRGNFGNKLRELTVSEREFRDEARALFGIDVWTLSTYPHISQITQIQRNTGPGQSENAK